MTMRQAIVDQAGGPDNIRIERTAIPEPGPGQLRIQVAYAALNPLDTHARALRVDWMHPGFPFVPGYEYAGRVEAVGDGVNQSRIGQRVACNGLWGGNADFAVVDSSRVIPVPEGFNWHTAATWSTCAYTAWLLIHSAGRVQRGQSVVIHSAAGAVGILCTQVALDAGAEVIALAGGAEKLAWIEQFGARHRLDYLDETWPERVNEITGGQGADLIIDGNAGANAVRNFECIAPLGQVIFMGATAGPAAPVDVSMLIGKSCSVAGFVQYFHQAVSNGRERKAMDPKLASGHYTIPVGKVYTLEELPEAHRAWENRELRGRALIKLGGEI